MLRAVIVPLNVYRKITYYMFLCVLFQTSKETGWTSRMPQRTVGILQGKEKMAKSIWVSSCTCAVTWACRQVLTQISHWAHDLFYNWAFGLPINSCINFFFSKRVKCSSSLLSTWRKVGDGRPSFSAQFSSQSLDKVDWFYVYTSERVFSLPKGVFFRPFRVILIVQLTFVMLSLRVQPSQRTACPLRTRLCIPATVPLHGLLLQQATPCLLLPHGWWAAFCVPHWHFHAT